MYTRNGSACAFVRVSVHDGPGSTSRLIQDICGSVIPDSIQSSTGEMTVVFQTHPYADIDLMKGFKASFATGW